MPIIRRRTFSDAAVDQEDQAVVHLPSNVAIADPPEGVDIQSDMTDDETGETILPEGLVVSLISENGNLTYVPAGCLDANHPQFFYGIVSEKAVQGDNTVLVSVGRGSIVVPLVENSVPLETGKQVYLSATPGRVTQDTAAIPNGKMVYRVGQAVSTTQMILNTDFREIWFISE